MTDENAYAALKDEAFALPEGDVVLSDRITLKLADTNIVQQFICNMSGGLGIPPNRLYDRPSTDTHASDEERIYAAYMDSWMGPLIDKCVLRMCALETRIRQAPVWALLWRSRRMKHAERRTCHGRNLHY